MNVHSIQTTSSVKKTDDDDCSSPEPKLGENSIESVEINQSVKSKEAGLIS